jgi:hypothetical protein
MNETHMCPWSHLPERRWRRRWDASWYSLPSKKWLWGEITLRCLQMKTVPVRKECLAVVLLEEGVDGWSKSEAVIGRCKGVRWAKG